MLGKKRVLLADEETRSPCDSVAFADSETGSPLSPRLVWRGLWVAWSPVLARTLTLGLTLLGLAAIGLAAGRSPSLERLVDNAPQQALALASVDTWLRPTAQSIGTGVAAPQKKPKSVAEASAESSKSDRPRVLPAEPCRENPRLREPEEKKRLTSRAKGSAKAPRVSPVPLIVNRASARQLTQLPGIGRKRAAQIVALRTRLGRFERLTDLLRVRGIGVKSLKKLLPHLQLDPRAVKTVQPPAAAGRI